MCGCVLEVCGLFVVLLLLVVSFFFIFFLVVSFHSDILVGLALRKIPDLSSFLLLLFLSLC